MYAVSLLPLEYRNYQSTLKRNDRFVFIGLIAALASLVVLVTSIAISSIYDGELERIKKDNKEIVKQIDELKPFEVLQAQVTDMLVQINEAAGLSPSWENVIAEIGNAVPATVGISSMTADYSDGVGKIIITGIASDHNEVSILLQNLSKINGLGEIGCIFSTKSDASNETGFEIDIASLSGIPYNLELEGVQ